MVGRYIAMIALLLCSIAVQANVVIYQPLNSDSELTKGQWQEIMLQLRERQIDTIALQWSQHEHSQFIDAEGRSRLQQVFHQANAQGLKIVVGLYHENSYYQRIQQQPRALHFYLRGLYNRHLDVARRWQAFTKLPAFAGWYISDEIDDLNWQSHAKQQLLIDYLSALNDQLATLAPAKPVYISSFYAGHSSPRQYAYLLERLAQHTDLELLWQDGVGTQVLSSDQRQAVQKYVCQKGSHIHVIAEIFNESVEHRLSDECRPSWFFSLRYMLPNYFASE